MWCVSRRFGHPCRRRFTQRISILEDIISYSRPFGHSFSHPFVIRIVLSAFPLLLCIHVRTQNLVYSKRGLRPRMWIKWFQCVFGCCVVLSSGPEFDVNYCDYFLIIYGWTNSRILHNLCFIIRDLAILMFVFRCSFYWYF